MGQNRRVQRNYPREVQAIFTIYSVGIYQENIKCQNYSFTIVEVHTTLYVMMIREEEEAQNEKLDSTSSTV